MYTIVSVCPFQIKEFKPQVIPEDYVIPPAPENGISVLHVNKSMRIDYRLHPAGHGITEKVPIPDDEMCASIINDFLIAQVIAGTEEAAPGLFYVEGEYSPDEIAKKFPDELAAARQRHSNWCLALVKLADDDWQKYRMHLFISDLQYKAADYLGLDREWRVKGDEIQQIKCPACMVYVNAKALICANCKFVLKPAELAKIQEVAQVKV